MHVNSSKLWIFVNNQTVQQSRFRREYPDFAWKSRLLANTRSGRIGNISISTRVVLFSSNSHKKERNAEFLTLISRKTEETAKVAIKPPKIFDKKEHQKFPWGACPQSPLAKGAQFRRLRQYLSKNFIPIQVAIRVRSREFYDKNKHWGVKNLLNYLIKSGDLIGREAKNR